MSQMFLESVYVLTLLASFLIAFKRRRRVVWALAICVVSWILLIIQLEVLISIEFSSGRILDGDGVKCLFAWYMGWLGSFVLFILGVITKFACRVFRTPDAEREI